ncbi:hypothetical protein E2C01_000718 [Portunus trituberculatus]|uniref:Uncharacterized protein n=1 Tax=Portunus trituberculatus TaxID=210409 RepID=A0A5B7CEV3_PORTR|nr:hypothetical protein [Portunus trituberculatus]
MAPRGALTARTTRELRRNQEGRTGGVTNARSRLGLDSVGTASSPHWHWSASQPSNDISH